MPPSEESWTTPKGWTPNLPIAIDHGGAYLFHLASPHDRDLTHLTLHGPRPEVRELSPASMTNETSGIRRNVTNWPQTSMTTGKIIGRRFNWVQNWSAKTSRTTRFKPFSSPMTPP